METTINKNGLFVNLKENVTLDNLKSYEKQISSAVKSGCNRIFFDFFKVNQFDNMFLEFILKFRNDFSNISFYNIDMNLLPTFYLMEFDKVANIYTSENDAINEKKPIIKRRFTVL